MLITFLFAAAFTAPQSVDSPPARTKVTSPFTQGEPVRITYDRQGGPLLADEELFAVATFETASGASIRHTPLTGGLSSRLSAELLAPGGAFFVAVDIVSRTAWDRGASQSALAVDRAGQPLRGARVQQMLQGIATYRSRVADELVAFPDSASAYRASWFCSSRVLEPDLYGMEVRTELRNLSGRDDPEALAVSSYGHLLLGDEVRARALLLRALETAPGSRFTARAVSDYWYECFSRGFPGGGDEIRRALRTALEKAPGSALARQQVRGLSFHGSAPLGVIEAVCRLWVAGDPLNPEPRFVLARALQMADIRLPEAQALALEAVASYFRGEARLTGDPSDSMATYLVPMAYAVAARAALQERRGETALGFALAGQSTQGQTEATPFELEARAWELLGRNDQATRAWEKARRRGSADAALSIVRLGGSIEGPSGTAGDDQPVTPAPEVQVTTLDGRTIALGGKRQEIVVLNFWGLGCAPCRTEIPGLSKLAESYPSSDVLFVALTQDPPADVAEFLEAHPFAYDQVASAHQAFAAFGVSGLPVHLIINRDGQIAGRLMGAGPSQTETLRRTIGAHLALRR